MALFEFDDGQLIPAQFGRTVVDGITSEILDAVRFQVLEIVSRPLFPITWRDLSRPASVDEESGEESRLTALDPSGQVVSVEVVQHLDSSTLISALSRLAQTATLSWSDLAREYPGNVDGFRADWAHFRDSMPPSEVASPRLVIVAASIDEQVRPALDVLAASGIEVHEMTLKQMSNGRAFLEVQTVGPRLFGHIPQILLGSTSELAQIASAQEPEAVGADVAKSNTAETDTAGSDAWTSSGSDAKSAGAGPQVRHEGEALNDRDSETLSGEPPAAPGKQAAETVEEKPADASQIVEDMQAQEELEFSEEKPDVANDETVEKKPDETSHIGHSLSQGDVAAQRPHAYKHSAGQEHSSMSQQKPRLFPPLRSAQATTSEHAAAEHARGEDSVRQANRAAEAAVASRLGQEPIDREAARALNVPLLEHDVDGLRALGEIIGQTAPLAVRHSLAPDLMAQLSEAGLIIVQGQEFSDPTDALVACGFTGLDGWAEWHLGDHLGPTLAESVDEVNRQMLREYQRAGAPRSSAHRH